MPPALTDVLASVVTRIWRVLQGWDSAVLVQIVAASSQFVETCRQLPEFLLADNALLVTTMFRAMYTQPSKMTLSPAGRNRDELASVSTVILKAVCRAIQPHKDVVDRSLATAKLFDENQLARARTIRTPHPALATFFAMALRRASPFGEDGAAVLISEINLLFQHLKSSLEVIGGDVYDETEIVSAVDTVDDCQLMNSFLSVMEIWMKKLESPKSAMGQRRQRPGFPPRSRS